MIAIFEEEENELGRISPANGKITAGLPWDQGTNDDLSSLFSDYFDEASEPLLEALLSDQEKTNSVSTMSEASKKTEHAAQQDEDAVVHSPKKQRLRHISSFDIDFEGQIMSCSTNVAVKPFHSPLKKKEGSGDCFLAKIGVFQNCTLCGEETNKACLECNKMFCSENKLTYWYNSTLAKQKFRTGRKATILTMKHILTCGRLHNLFIKYELVPILANLPFLLEAAKEELALMDFYYPK